MTRKVPKKAVTHHVLPKTHRVIPKTRQTPLARTAPTLQGAGEATRVMAGAQGWWLRGHFPEPLQSRGWKGMDKGGERGGGQKMCGLDVHLPCPGESTPAPQAPPHRAPAAASRARAPVSPSLKSSKLKSYQLSDSALQIKFCS